MTSALLSLRGYTAKLPLVRVNLDSCVVEEEILLGIPNAPYVPESKTGSCGIAQLSNRTLAIALWDRVIVVEPDSGRLLREYSDQRFSDLHSIHADEKDTIWVSNTNLDGVYTITDARVESVWHAWETDCFGPRLDYVPDDYRKKVKEDIPYHRLHLNSVLPTDDHIICSFLGERRRPGRVEGFIRRRIPAMRFGRTFRGGYVVLERSTNRIRSVIHAEGLHDTKPLRDGGIWSTQYFGAALLRLDPGSLSTRSLRLQVPNPHRGGYLTRGLLETGDGLWVGHTVPRGWTDPDVCACLRRYDFDGRWTGSEIRLPGYVGVYDILRCGD